MSNLFDLKSFISFAEELRVETKEYGIIRLGKRLYGTQRKLVASIAEGLPSGIHTYVILKGRQEGISTIGLAFDLYWAYAHPGTQGSLVTNDDGNREMFRSTLKMYMKGLPKPFKVPEEGHNRYELTLRNRSRLTYQVAGERKGGGLSRGKAINFLHATEVGSWVDAEGLASLQASLAEKHENRLYLYESTAKGFNLFHDMWQVAKRSRTQAAVFIGWWLKEDYSVDKGPVYEVYGYTGMSPAEKKWVREVKQLYGHEITRAQLAWWRWKLNDEIKDEQMMLQEYPPTENDAFLLSGTNFFDTAALTAQYKRSIKEKPECYVFDFREHFEDTQLKPCNEKNATLMLWKKPVKGAVYAIGADPAYGASETSDQFCLQVLRCYADKMEQVAEFCTSVCNTAQFAWVATYLSAVYGPAAGAFSMLNLEINGPGQAVLQELNMMKRNVPQAGGLGNDLLDVVGNVRGYLYRRPDNPGRGYVNHWKTNHESKERMLNHTNNAVSSEHLVLHSSECIEEMRLITRDNGRIVCPDHAHDDRAIALALGVVAWFDFMRQTAAETRQFYMAEQAKENGYAEDLSKATTDGIVRNFLEKWRIAPSDIEQPNRR